MIPIPCSKRVLLLASETALESEVRAALQNQQRDGESSLLFDLVYVDPALIDDFFSPGLVGLHSTRSF